MSCYAHRLGELFQKLGVENSAENQKKADAIIRQEYEIEELDCPSVWRMVKQILADESVKQKFIEQNRANW